MFQFGIMHDIVPKVGQGLVKIIKPAGSPEGPHLNDSTPLSSMITSLKNAFMFNC